MSARAEISPYWNAVAQNEAAIFYGDSGQDVYKAWRAKSSVVPLKGHSQYKPAFEMMAASRAAAWWGGLNLFTTDEVRIKAFAKDEARRFDRLFSDYRVTDTERLMASHLGCEPYQVKPLNFGGGAWYRAIMILAEFGLKLDDVFTFTRSNYWEDVLRNRLSIVRRLVDWRWWQRRARVQKMRFLEEQQRQFGLVNASNNYYLSELNFLEWQTKQKTNIELLEQTEIENDAGERFNLADLFYTSTSNPAIRRIELMTRVSGLEKLASELGYQSTFITLTCPSRFHAFSYRKQKGRKTYAFKNKLYDGSTVRDAQDYLRKTWAEIRADFGRVDADVFGLRIAEPHHDGCPHWHILLFTRPDVHWVAQEAKDCPPVGISQVEQIITKHGLKDSPNERGASRSRVVIERIRTGINPATGRNWSAVGYIAKYISKAIDGKHIETTKSGEDAQKSAQRVRAWASVHGVRQFQQFGGVPVTLWRELRRLGSSFVETDADGVRYIDTPKIFAEMAARPELVELYNLVIVLEQYEDKSAAYCHLNMRVRSSDFAIGVLKNDADLITVDQSTGEIKCIPQKFNQYGEESPTLKGLVFFAFSSLAAGIDQAAEIITRPHNWRIVPKAPPQNNWHEVAM